MSIKSYVRPAATSDRSRRRASTRDTAIGRRTRAVRRSRLSGATAAGRQRRRTRPARPPARAPPGPAPRCPRTGRARSSPDTSCSIEKSASRTLSAVGRVPAPRGAASRMPFRSPATILIGRDHASAAQRRPPIPKMRPVSASSSRSVAGSGSRVEHRDGVAPGPRPPAAGGGDSRAWRRSGRPLWRAASTVPSPRSSRSTSARSKPSVGAHHGVEPLRGRRRWWDRRPGCRSSRASRARPGRAADAAGPARTGRRARPPSRWRWARRPPPRSRWWPPARRSRPAGTAPSAPAARLSAAGRGCSRRGSRTARRCAARAPRSRRRRPRACSDSLTSGQTT